MKNKLLFSLLSLWLLLPYTSLAQDGHIPLLFTESDPRTTAMGGFSTGGSNQNFLYTDPAAILYRDIDFSFSLSAASLPTSYAGFMDAYYGFNAAWRYAPTKALMAGIRYQGKELIRFQKDNRYRSAPDYTDIALDLGYAWGLSRQFSLFAKASAIRVAREDIHNAFTASLGANYHTELSFAFVPANLYLGLRWENFGSYKNNLADTTYSLPSDLSAVLGLGLSIAPGHQLQLGYGFRHYYTKAYKQDLCGGLGAEYTYAELLSLRAGLRFLGQQQDGYNLGVGLKLERLQIDYAFSMNQADKKYGFHLLSLNYAF